MTDRRLARLAGAFYLLIILAGVTSEVVLRAPFHVGSQETVAAALSEGLGRLRLSLLFDLAMVGADITVALLFYRLLAPVSAGLSLAAMVFRLMQAATIAMGLILLAGIPTSLTSGADVQAATLLTLHGIAYDTGLALFAVNCWLMGWLLWQAGNVPKVIAAGIALSGGVYMAGSLARLAAPDLLPLIQPAYLVPLLAETGLCLWLLITGRVRAR